jgi:hypothetical protein
MAKNQNRQTKPSLVEVNEKLRQLNDVQLRILVMLMIDGNEFMDAYEVAKTYEQSPTTE